MEKIVFEDLPSTDTPINSSNLNTLQDNVENSFKNEYSESQTDTYSCDYLNPKLLWTNPNPNSDFAAQTITISNTDYDVLEIFYIAVQSTNKQLKSVKTIKNYNTILDYYDGYSSKGALRTAGISGNQITFSNSFYDSGSSSQNYCIPIYIIGYKTGLFN